MPHDLENDLVAAARLERLRSQYMLLELRQLLDPLQEVGASPLVLKGAALSHLFNLDRSFADLDILVLPSSLESASLRLGELGYRAKETVRSDSFYEQHHFHRVLQSPAGVTVELHWALTRPSDYFKLSAIEFQSRGRAIPFHDTIMRVPCHADLLLHAAAQSLREGFTNVRRVLDAVLLLGAGADDDPDLPRRIREASLEGAMWVLLIITEELTGVFSKLREQVCPTKLRRISLEALDPPKLLLDQRALALPGLRRWLLLLCAPRPAVTMRALFDGLFPGERGLLEDGHQPGSLPGMMYRAVLSGKRIMQTAKLAGYQLWRLGTSRAVSGRE